MNPSPFPNPSNVVVHGRTRLTLLTPRLLRIEWAADGRFEDRATLAVVNRHLPTVPHRARRVGAALELRARHFTLRLRDGNAPPSAATLSVRFTADGRTRRWTPGLAPRGNLGGTLRTLDGIRGNLRQVWKETAPGRWQPTDRWTPVDLGTGFLSRDGWALVDDSGGVALDHETGWVRARESAGRRDGYLFLHGCDYAGALRDAALVFGRQPLPPRFAFGYWWSRYWAYTDREIEDLAADFDAHDVPLNVMVVDMDWHLEGWTGYTWDRRYFPDPREFLRRLRARGLKITLNLHPADGVGRHEEAFPAMCRALGRDPRTTDRIPFDATDPAFIDAYFRLLHHPLEKDGVDFWWLDWQQGSTTALPGLDPLPWLNQLHWRDMERHPARRGRRPLIFSRFGGPGAGRYCIGFSGDTHSVWESLAFQPRFTATASNVLYGYWSHDIGGHQPGEIDAELYTRWMQFGVYAPVLRTHTTKNCRAERRFWAYPDPFGRIMMDAVRHRYELIPYIYTEARRAYDTGISLCRPMYYAYPRDPRAYRHADQYFFGDELLVAPILRAAAPDTELTPVSVWLPPGRWFDTARGAWEKGGRTVTRKYLFSETPVFVRPGAIVPGQVGARRPQRGGYTGLLVTAYPGGAGCYDLYEDDGESTDYQRDGCARIPLRQSVRGRTRTLTVGPVSGRYRGMPRARTLEVRLPGSPPPRAVTVGGRRLAWTPRLGREGWTYDGDRATVVIRLARLDLARGTRLRVTYAGAPDDPRVDGLAGNMARLERVGYYSRLATWYHTVHLRERLGIEAAQTGNRITRQPGRFAAEMRALPRMIRELRRVLRELAAAQHEHERQPNRARETHCFKALAFVRDCTRSR